MLRCSGPLLVSLVPQVRGFCEDKSNPEVFDDVNVYGNMYDSDIHHLRFGLYTYGEQHRSRHDEVLHLQTAESVAPALKDVWFPSHQELCSRHYGRTVGMNIAEPPSDGK